MSRRLNNPEFLLGYFPLNNHLSGIDGYNRASISSAGITYSNNPFGRTAASFNGTTSTIGYGDVSAFKFGSNSFSYGCWVYVTSSQGGFDMPLNKGGSSAALNGFDIELGTGSWTGNISDGSSVKQVTFTTEALGIPHHVFVVVDRTNSLMYAYLDGVLKATNSLSGFGSTTGTSNFTIGNSGASSHWFKGLVWDVRIYNVALTGAEVLALYQLGQRVPKPIVVEQPIDTLPDVADTTLVASYLNSKSIGSANDISNNYLNGTSTNIQWEKIGAKFNGNSKILITDTIIIQNALAGNHTISFWFKITTLATNYFLIGYRQDANNAMQLTTTTNSGQIQFSPRINGTSYQSLTAASSFASNVFSYVVCTFDGTNSRIYVDGILKATGNTNSSFNGYATTSGLTIGYRNTTSAELYLNGLIKNVQIYSQVKSAKWIYQEFKKGVPDSSLLLSI